MSIFVCIDGRIVVRANVAIQRKLAEERSHAACDARHRAEGSEHHGLDMGMRVEGRVDAFLDSDFAVSFQNCIPHPILQSVIHNTIELTFPLAVERCFFTLRSSLNMLRLSA